MQITVGNVIDDRYEIICPIAGGGFAMVYKAFQKQFDRMVAIKVLERQLLADEDTIPRFEREAKAVSALRHKNIVAMYGYGVWEDAPYMVMELVEGTSLHEVIINEKKLDPKRAAQLLLQVCEGLEEAHRSGIVHRDLKPPNIMITQAPDGTELVKIIDFGLAKLMPGYGLPAQKLTETGTAMGTCTYMAPEQCTGLPVDARVDLYSAGCILYQCLMGVPPFVADANVAVMFMHLNEPHTPVPIKGLDRIVDKALAKNVDERYASASEMYADLKDFLAGKTPAIAGVSRITRTNKKGLKKSSLLTSVAVVSILMAVALASWLQRASMPGLTSLSSIELYNLALHEPPASERRKTLIWKALTENATDKKLDAARQLQLHRALIKVYVDERNFVEAYQTCKRNDEVRDRLAPNDPDKYLDRLHEATCLVELGEYETAKGLLKSILNAGDFPFKRHALAQAHTSLARVYIAQRNTQEAINELRLAVNTASDPELQEEARILLGEALVIHGEPKEALKWLKQAKELHGPMFTGRIDEQLLRCLLLNKQYEEAQQVSLAMDPRTYRQRGHAFNVYLLKIATAAFNDDRPVAEALTRREIEAKNLPCGSPVVCKIDRDLCCDALKQAKYPDLLKQLQTKHPDWIAK
jgi:serine/threonine protein kinase